MISLHSLRAGLVGDRVAFDENGALLDVEIPDDAGPAILLVSPITDALKRVEGDRVVGSIDRGEMCLLDAIVLDREVLDRLDDRSVSTEELLEAVPAVGYEWEVSSTSAP